MKKLFTLSVLALLLGFSTTSCESPEGSIADTSAQMDMDRKSFEVSTFELYDHETQVNTDIVAVNDHVYLTFKDNEVFLTKENLENGNVHFRFDEFASNFEGGALQGIYLDEYNYMKVAHFSRDNGQFVMELEGITTDKEHFTTIFVVMNMLNGHPAGAAQISGLPG
jgi:hypothetical protein